MRHRLIVSTVLTGVLTLLPATAQSPAPKAVVDEVLDADRGYSKAASSTTVAQGVSAMFTEDVVMPMPGGRFAKGKAEARAALEANPDSAGARVDWAPVRGGISADGHHGFTFGYMTLHKPDKTTVPIKYLAYWVKANGHWRVAVYRRSRAEKPPTARALRPPALPAAIVPVSTDAAAMARHRDSLDAVERAFSDEAQKIGIGPAFAKYGRADAVNAGPPAEPDYVTGADAIGKMVGGGSTAGGSPVSWAPESVIVASSGDLGVTIGFIRANAPGPDGAARPPIPFFTVWYRESPADPWRYIAE